MAQISKKMKNKRSQLGDVKKTELAKNRQEELEEICVVGYQCKLFRDDTRAKAIDRGEHLIPWMGDASLMIDRYDGRGLLPNLDLVGWDQQGLSAEEDRIETLCDEERYMALHKDIMEEEQRHEEEIKRLNIAIASSDSYYGEVAFSYGTPGNVEYDPMRPTEDEQETPFTKSPPRSETPELEEPFIAPAELNIPVGVQMPATKKTHKFMEKTALFIVGQGSQMEIILKTKQANNPQFAFLQFDHYLNPYYKHLFKCLKSGRYRPKPDSEDEDDEKRNHRQQGGKSRVRKHSDSSLMSNDDDDDDDDDDNNSSGYLHPSLLGQSKPRPTPMQAGTTTIQTSTSVHHGTYPSMGYADPTTAYHHHHDPNYFAGGDPIIISSRDPALLSGDLALLQNPGYYDPNLYSMYPPPPPPPLSDGSGTALPLPTVPLPSFSGMDTSSGYGLPVQSLHQGVGSGLGSAGSPPSMDDSKPETTHVIPPPPDIQPVIDKLAKYVAKNGNDFEASVRDKSDARFDFLLPWHKYNAYYVRKKKMYIAEMGAKGEEWEEEEGHDEDDESQMTKVSVSFSIKTKGPKDDRPLDRRSALPVESSDSETGDDQPPSRQNPNRTGPPGSPDLLGDHHHPPSHLSSQPPFNPAFRDWTPAGDPPYGGPPGQGSYSDGYRESPPPYRGVREPDFSESEPGGAGEAPDRDRITVEEFKQAKMRLEDRLAQAARDKMASASKDRIQQMERRKKAAMFLSMIKDRPQAGAVAEIDVMDADCQNIPSEQPRGKSPPPRSPEEKRQKTNASDRRKHKKHRHRRSPHSSPPERKHHHHRRRPSRCYQVVNTSPPRSADGIAGGVARSRSSSPGNGRDRPAQPPKSYQAAVNRSPKRHRRSQSRSNSPIWPLRSFESPLRSFESPLRRSSSVGPSSLPNKSRSQSPENNNRTTRPAVSVLSQPKIEAQPLPPPPSADELVNLGNEDSSTNLTDLSRDNGSTQAAKDADFKNEFRAKIRAMLAATRQMDFKPS